METQPTGLSRVADSHWRDVTESNKTTHNEVYNNMGIIYYNMNDRENAALAWQKAVVYMPSDSMARDNLALVQSYRDKRG